MNDLDQRPSQRGGARPGTGRKQIGEGVSNETKVLNFRVKIEDHEYVKAHIPDLSQKFAAWLKNKITESKRKSL